MKRYVVKATNATLPDGYMTREYTTVAETRLFRTALRKMREWYNQGSECKIFDRKANKCLAGGLPALGWLKIWR